MNRIIALLIATPLLISAEAGQKKKTPPRPPRPVSHKPAAAETKPAVSPMAGTPVVIVTKNGDHISGTIVDMNAYSIKIKSGGLESSIAFDTLSSLSFGTLAPETSRAVPSAAPNPDFPKDTSAAVNAFQSMVDVARTGSDYTEYGRQLSELRPQAERFIARYGPSENAREARVVALLAGALTDYSWARTIWTLKLGRQSDGTVGESDSQIIVDVLALYPDLRSAATTGNRFTADKLIAGLWKRASEKVERTRAALAQSR